MPGIKNPGLEPGFLAASTCVFGVSAPTKQAGEEFLQAADAAGHFSMRLEVGMLLPHGSLSDDEVIQHGFTFLLSCPPA
ncbi:MAG: hypothetical protein R3D35_07215 [Nitratireductor sp.]